MKHYFFFIVLFAAFFSPVLSSGQINLVPNPSFEDTVFCPIGLDQLNASQFWSSYRNSPDYFNSCNSLGLNVPNSIFGFQHAHTGNAMCGLILYRRPNLPSGPNYREYAGCQLTQPLIPGMKYFISFFVNFSYDLPLAIASNNFGIKFSTVSFDVNNPIPITNWTHLNLDSILLDSIQWVRVNGELLADSSYSYLILGNFFDDSNTDTIEIGNFPDNSYYYFDDICVTTDSMYNSTWTRINEIDSWNFVNIYPNPVHEFITIHNLEVNCEYYVHDLIGKLVFRGVFEKNPTIQKRIDVSELNDGVYLITFKNKAFTFSRKFIKNHAP